MFNKRAPAITNTSEAKTVARTVTQLNRANVASPIWFTVGLDCITEYDAYGSHINTTSKFKPITTRLRNSLFLSGYKQAL